MADLNGRLKAIAANIKEGQTMADIGTDHGFLPLYLWKNGVCPRIIMTDISESSLDKAKAAFNGCADDPGVIFRPGDGLRPLMEGEADAVVMAGMGGALMVRILEDDVSKTLSFGRYIFQPRSGAGKLRYWLEGAGFSIISEDLAAEGKFICEIITAKPPGVIGEPPSLKDFRDEIKYEVPGRLRAGSEHLLEKFLSKKLGTEKKVLKAMSDGKIKDMTKISRIESRIGFLEDRLGELSE